MSKVIPVYKAWQYKSDVQSGDELANILYHANRTFEKGNYEHPDSPNLLATYILISYLGKKKKSEFLLYEGDYLILNRLGGVVDVVDQETYREWYQEVSK